MVDQVGRLEHLAEEQVARWRCVEMAIRDSGVGGPQFSDADAPCLQVQYLQADLANGQRRTISIYQDDANFGLCLVDGDFLLDREWDGIYRIRDLAELPIGRVDAASVLVDEGIIAELTLTVAQVPILLIAAEIYESADASLEWHRFDESVLVFREPRQADTITWLPARPSRSS